MTEETVAEKTFNVYVAQTMWTGDGIQVNSNGLVGRYSPDNYVVELEDFKAVMVESDLDQIFEVLLKESKFAKILEERGRLSIPISAASSAILIGHLKDLRVSSDDDELIEIADSVIEAIEEVEALGYYDLVVAQQND